MNDDCGSCGSGRACCTAVVGVQERRRGQRRVCRSACVAWLMRVMVQAADTASNTGDVVAIAGTNIVGVGPDGQQERLQQRYQGGVSAGPWVLAYQTTSTGCVTVPQALGPILKIGLEREVFDPVPNAGMAAPDRFGTGTIPQRAICM